MRRLRDIASKIKWSERHVCLGNENKDKTFYVIRRNSKEVGLFSYVLTILGHIKLAEEKGYIPVVDMQNYLNPYIERKGDNNAWEYYFEQPGGYTLNDIKKSRNIILSSGQVPSEMPGFSIFIEEEELLYWRDVFKKYIVLNKGTRKYVDGIQCSLFDNEEKILGVLCRGTDYRKLQPRLHPIQPEVIDVINLTKKIMNEKKCQKVYLATEDIDILNHFREEFGENLIFPDIKLREYKAGELISLVEVNREDDKRLKGLEYLTQIALLSRCNYFIGSGCGGSYAALLMSEGYEWQYLWNLGVY